MDITGKIIAALPPRTGTSAKGTQWQCNTYVLETQEQYPKKVAFDVFGSDRISQFNIQTGEYLTVSIDIDAHDYQGRWYNQIRAWSVSRQQASQPVSQPSVAPPVQQGAIFAQQSAAAIPPQPAPPTQSDLPF